MVELELNDVIYKVFKILNLLLRYSSEVIWNIYLVYVLLIFYFIYGIFVGMWYFVLGLKLLEVFFIGGVIFWCLYLEIEIL